MKKSNNKKPAVRNTPVLPFSYRTEPNYYYAFIGPISREELDEKFGNGEGHIRRSIQEAFYQCFGKYAETCSSGWGVTPQTKDEAGYSLDNDEVKKAMIASYYDEKKPLPRALRAWELYFDEQERLTKAKKKR